MTISIPVTPGIFRPELVAEAPVKFIEEIWPEVFSRNIALGNLGYHPGCVRFDEIVFIASITKFVSPRRIFEIGTCRGRTTANIARNADRLSVLYTLNLPPQAGNFAIDWIEQDRLLYEDSKLSIGELYANQPFTDKIVQLYGDSMQFDFEPYRGVDMVFIDANKSRDYVYSDTLNGWKILNSGGLILWHDYGYCDGVTSAVDAFARDFGVEVINIHKSTLAVASK